MAASRRAGRERGQATPEWVGLMLLMALLFLAAFAKLEPLRLGLSLARALGSNLLCAVRLEDKCGEGSNLEAAYGAELAATVRRHAPEVLYEQGMRALPVDFRSCRAPSCADGDSESIVWRSRSGEPATAFVHLIDCRRLGLGGAGTGADCSGSKAGSLYLQYWFFYPDSATLRGVPVAGREGYHRDDWESYQVRIGTGRTDVRASSHRGYNYGQGAENWGSESGIGILRGAAETAGLRSRGAWGPETGLLFVSGGSHAGNAKAIGLDYTRLTPARRLKLVPLESLAAGEQPDFAVTPPWLKLAWRDPESDETG